MASGNQKVKTPSGWNATQGAWVKTGASTWKAVDQIYIKTPDGWNNASGQEATQIPYPYIANAQEPNIRQTIVSYPYIANAQQPNIRNKQTSYPYQASAQEPNIRQTIVPYPYIANAQEPNIRQTIVPYPYIANGQQPNERIRQVTYSYNAVAQEPNTYDHRSPFTYDHRSPFTYALRSPFTYNYRSPFTYQNNARQPNTYQAPARQPVIANARQPNTYQAPARQPFIANARQPATYQAPARQPFIASARQPATYQAPARQPSIGNARNPFTYQARTPVYVPGPSGCFSANMLILMGDNTLRPISEVEAGMHVLSFNFETNLLESREVGGMMVPREDIQLYDVKLSNGNHIEISGGHPISTSRGWRYINEDAWKMEVENGIADFECAVGEFKVGDELFYFGEQGVIVESITKQEELQTTHNILLVDSNENYFVNGVLVHNGQKK